MPHAQERHVEGESPSRPIVRVGDLIYSTIWQAEGRPTQLTTHFQWALGPRRQDLARETIDR